MSDNKDNTETAQENEQRAEEQVDQANDLGKTIETAIDLLVAQFDEKLSIESASVDEKSDAVRADNDSESTKKEKLVKRWIDAREFVSRCLETRHDNNVVLCGFLARQHICNGVDETQTCAEPLVTDEGYTKFRLADWYVLLDLVVECDQGARAISIIDEIHRIELKERNVEDTENGTGDNGTDEKSSTDTAWSPLLQHVFDEIIENANQNNNLNVCKHLLMSKTCRAKLSADQLHKLSNLLHDFLSDILRKESHDGILVYRKPETVRKWLASLRGETFATMIQAVEFMEEFHKRQRVVHDNKIQAQAKRAKTSEQMLKAMANGDASATVNSQQQEKHMDSVAHALVAHEYPEFQEMIASKSLIGADKLLQVCHDRRKLEHEAILEHLVPVMSSYRNLHNTASDYLTQKEVKLRYEAKDALDNLRVQQRIVTDDAADDSDADVADKLPRSIADEKTKLADEIKQELSELSLLYDAIRNGSTEGLATNTPENLQSLQPVELDDTELRDEDMDLQDRTGVLAKQIMELMAEYIKLRNRQSIVRARRINVVADAKKSFKEAELDEFHKHFREESAKLTAASYFAD